MAERDISPGSGRTSGGKAADDLLDELLQPYLDKLRRHAELGMTAAAADHAVGILRGLHRLRANSSETLPEYCPDYADERAAKVVRQWAAMGVALPLDDLVGVLSDWEPLIQQSIGPRAERSTL